MSKIFDKPIAKNIPWDGNELTNNLPVKGKRIEDFLKETLDKKAGEFYYDSSNNRYLIFADSECRQQYLEDPTKTQLLLGTFNAPFNYTAEINLLTPKYNAIFNGDKNNTISFTFDIKNKQGDSTGEDVYIEYSIIRNSTKKTYNTVGKSGQTINLLVDEYLDEGTNTIIIGITGQNTLAATTTSVTYQVVNLSLEDEFDISTVYDLSTGSKTASIGFTVSGFGTKIVEWYLDGQLLPFVKSEDEVVETFSQRTKYIELSNLSQGSHSLQFRVYTSVNGENFYSDIHYRELIVYTGTNEDNITAIALTIPAAQGIITDGNIKLYGVTQYIPYNVRFAVFSPKNLAIIPVTLNFNDVQVSYINAINNKENIYTLVTSDFGDKVLSIITESSVRNIPIEVSKTTMKLGEITSDLAFDFSAVGKTNDSKDYNKWSYKTYKGTFTGFNWNATSGWIDNCLKMSAGSSFSIDYAPFDDNPTTTGRTIEFEFKSTNVSNDDAVICDLRNEDGVGLLITATKATLKSADGVIIETEYKPEEFVRMAFVINRAVGSTRKTLTAIYANGCISRCVNWAVTDSYTSDKQLTINATTEAEVELKYIRVYNTALSDDQIWNNYTLYRSNINDMVSIYNRNDIYVDGGNTFSPDKSAARLPVMIVTGDIPTLENTSDKDTQIIVDIEYTNLQDPSRSFTMKGAAMRPQGTSSMGYPKKNFRIYTQKVSNTILYDYKGNIIEDKLYSFKERAIPVNCWCLKADYAESSGTHNVGIARMWNQALLDAQVDGEYVCRTNAQKIAIESGYPYDVRTTIDGFPILLYYKPTKNDEPIFIGKYNFNNDKSTEKVFGFTDIEGFDNSRMQCWELLNNGNALGLFQTISGFDTNWKEAFESRYPDTKTPNTTDLKSFCTWMSSVDQNNFTVEKWNHMNVWMMAAYYCYLMRHAAADQFVKNSMLTSEDGEHFYFILYDNDTIQGLINTGDIAIDPTDDRNSVDASGTYKFAGHDSRLWNMLEADDEFMNMVKTVDNALYSAGISYNNAIKIFDDEQSDKWVERVYNQDSEYKYIGPFVNNGINNLFMLQGRRDLHRRWWLSKRFSLYDSKFVSGEYKSQAIEIKCQNDTQPGQEIKITSGYPLNYGYGINNIPRVSGITLQPGESYTFNTVEKVNLGDPIRIYGAPNLAELDISQMCSRLAVVTVANVFTESLGTKFKKLILGNTQQENLELSEISGLKMASKLEYLDIQNMKAMTSLNLADHKYFKTLKAFGSNIASVQLSVGAPVERLELPAVMKTLILEQLPYLEAANVKFENIKTLHTINIKNCPKLSNDFNWIYNWYGKKTTTNDKVSISINNVDWTCTAQEFLILCAIKEQGGTLDLQGKVTLPELTFEQASKLIELFGSTVFNSNSSFYISAPPAVFVIGNKTILEGNTETFTLAAIGYEIDTIEWKLMTSVSGITIDQTGKLIITEGVGNRELSMQVIATTTTGEKLIKTEKINIIARTYPSISYFSIDGPIKPEDGDVFTLACSQEYTGNIHVEWSFTGDLINYAEIIPNGSSCTFIQNGMVTTSVMGVLTATITKVYNNASIGSLSLDISMINDNIAENDPEICRLFYTAGLTANETYITKQEAANIPEESVLAITFASNKGIKSFDGFKYFTQVTRTVYGMFQYCVNLESITLPETITSLNSNTFTGTKLKSIIIPESVTGIGVSCFSGCKALQYCNIPNSIKTINSFTFQGCTSLNNIVLPDQLVSMQTQAFWSCSSLTHIYIPKSTIQIASNAFEYCSSFNTIEVDPENTRYSSFDGCNVLVDTQTNTLIQGSKSAIIPETVTKIQQYAFYYCAPKFLNIPNSVVTIESEVFTNSTNLEEIIIPDHITIIPYRAFYRCSNLKTVHMPKNCQEIGSGAFAYCKALTTIEIPNSVTKIGSQAFSESGLLNITLSESVTSIGDGAFQYCRNLISAEIQGECTTLSGTFSDCSSLETVIIKSTKLTHTTGFRACDVLKTIYFYVNTAPTITSDTFFAAGSNNGGGTIYVPTGAVGYDEGLWVSDSYIQKNFTISATL